MNFQCKNCGGNVVWSPEKHAMECPYCGGIDCEAVEGDASLTVCAACGGEVSINELTSASRCEYCGNSLVFNERVEGNYKPDSIIPFSVSKDMAVTAMESEFRKRIFTPASFLSEKTLKELNGFYVPFFMYDFDAESVFVGTGTKVRRWRSGNYDYTETSYYEIRRRMQASYDNIPVDASYSMDDTKMDLMEPYDYSELMGFNPKYLSGFFGEIYNDTKDKFADRAKKKAVASASTLLHESIKSYATVSSTVDETTLRDGKVDYTLFPVWKYTYAYAGKTYDFFINGQSGKVIGKTPVSLSKVILYGLTVGGFTFGLLQFALRILAEVL